VFVSIVRFAARFYLAAAKRDEILLLPSDSVRQEKTIPKEVKFS
jgi:hypothetical protein